MMKKQRNQLLLEACGRALRDCLADSSMADWEKLVLRVHIGEGHCGGGGYFFDAQGKYHATSPDSESLESFEELREVMAAEESRAWLSALIVIAADGALDVQFEYDDADRWRVTPDNYQTRIAEFAALPVPKTHITPEPPPVLSPAELHALFISMCQSAVFECGASLPDNWQKLVLCGEYGGGSAGMSGYAFDTDNRAHACAPRGKTLEKLKAWHEALVRSGERPWVAVQIVIAVSGFFHVEYEYDNPGRWAVTPKNLDARIAEFAALPTPQAQ